MNTLPKKLNIFSDHTLYRLSPTNWVDCYWEEFFNEAFKLTNNEETSKIIVEKTFFKGIIQINEFNGSEDEHTWLLRILCNEISLKSHTLIQKSDFSLFYQKCLDGVSFIEKEAFRLKTYKKEKTINICNKLNISEEQFWNYINSMRGMLTDSIQNFV